jgi:hypothetical protein
MTSRHDEWKEIRADSCPLPSAPAPSLFFICVICEICG